MSISDIKPPVTMEYTLSDRLRAVAVTLEKSAVPLLVLGTLAIGAAAGLSATSLPLRRLALLVALPVLLIAIYAPQLAILLMVLLGATLFDPSAVANVFRLSAVELCLVLLLGLVVIRALSNARQGYNVRTPLDWPLLLLFVASTVALFNAKYIFESFHYMKSVPIWRTLFNFMVFFAVTQLIRNRRQLMILVVGMFVLATLVALLMVAQQIVGPSANFIPDQQGVGIVSVLGQRQDGVMRVAFPGAAMVFVMLLPAFMLFITPGFLEGRKRLVLFPVLLFPLAILFTFTRGLWLGIVLSSIVFVIFTRTESKRFVLLLAILIVGTSLLLPMVSHYFPRADRIAEAVSLRAGSLFAGSELEYDSSTQWRIRENELALAKIMENPIWGVGLGGDYRPRWHDGDGLTHYVHNGFLFLLLQIGLVGLVPFLWLSLVFVIRGFHYWRTITDPVLRGLVMGFSLSYIAVLYASISSPRLLEPNFVLLMGIMLGVNEVAIRLAKQYPRSTNGAE